MNVRRWMPWLALGLVIALAVAGVGYGSNNTAAKPAAKAIKVGVITDIGGLNDHGFNQLANQGRIQADKLPGVSTRVLTSKSGADYIPNLLTLAQANYDLIIGVGFLMSKEVGTIAKRFPKLKFAGVDEHAVADIGDGTAIPNARGLVFKEEEAGCLVGDLAARVIKAAGGQQEISAVGGQKVPAVDAFIAGYRFCAKRVTPSIDVSFGYSQSFTDTAKCKELALNQIASGSRVVFAVAGGCGLGALDAAKERKKWGIGVDADQSFLGPHILTSAVKRVNVAVLDTVKLVRSGKFKGGVDRVFSVKDNGVALGKVSSKVPKKLVRQTLAVQARLKAGKLKPPRNL